MSQTVLRAFEMLGTFFGVSLLLTAGLATGTETFVLTVELLNRSVQVVLFEGVVTVAFFSVSVAFAGAFLAYQVWKTNTKRVYAGAEVRAVVPVYRDAEVLEVSVGSLLETEYENLSVVVVTEPDDPETQRRAEELAEEHDAVDYLVNANPGSKGTAINHAVEESDADYFAVFDADERVSPDFIPTAMGELLGDADVFQGRRVPRAVGPIETIAYCERALVDAGYAVCELLGFTGCGSASTVFTREAFETVGGYERSLAEDMEFAHACNHTGMSIVHDRSATNTMEAPHTVHDLWGQRKRWRMGQVRASWKRLAESLRGGSVNDAVGSAGRAVGGVAAGLVLLFVASHAAVLAAQEVETVLVAPFISAVLTVGGVWTKDYAEGRVGFPSWTVVLAPLVYVGHGFLTLKAVFECILTWEGHWYRVAKKGV